MSQAERWKHAIALGDAGAVYELVKDARRRGALSDVLELYREQAPQGDVDETFRDALLWTARDHRAEVAGLVTSTAQAWAGVLKDRPELVTLLLGISVRKEDWLAVGAALKPEGDVEAAVKAVSQLRSNQLPDSVLKLGFYAVFVASEWYVGLMKHSDPEARAGWQRLLGHFSDHPATPWIATRVFDAFTSMDRSRIKKNLGRCYLDVFDGAAALPVLHRAVLEKQVGFKDDDLLWDWLATRPHRRSARGFVERLQHSKKAVRSAALYALSQIGESSLEAIYELLRSDDKKTLEAAAQALETVPHASSIPLLEEQLAKKHTKKIREALQRALTACQLASGTADVAAVDAELAKRKVAKVPDFLAALELPELRWKGGAAMSEGARLWFVRQLIEEGPTTGDSLKLIRERLEDDGVWALGEQLWALYDGGKLKSSKAKGVMYGLWVVASPKRIERLGADLERIYKKRGHAWAAHGVNILARYLSPEALMWLERWAFEGTKSLQQNAQDAMRGLMWKSERSWDGLMEQHIPNLGFDAQGEQTFEYGAAGTITLRLGEGGSLTMLLGGEEITKLPRAKSGEGEMAKAARKHLEDIGRSIDAARASLGARFERSMAALRTWTPGELKRLACHPVARCTLESLVFEDVEDSVPRFRVAREHLFANIQGAEVSLADVNRVRLAHPAAMTAPERKQWETHLSRLKLSQAFPQMGRSLLLDASKLRQADYQTGSQTEWNGLTGYMLGQGFTIRHGVGYERRYANGETIVFSLYFMEAGIVSLEAMRFKVNGSVVPAGEVGAVTLTEGWISAQRMAEYINSHQAMYYGGWE